MNAHNSYPRILTDETNREKVSHGNEKYPFMFYLEDIWQFEFHCVDWHWHPEFEFVYVEKGTAIIYAGNNRHILSAGNGIFINSQIIHRFESEGSVIIPNIVFSPLLLAPKESLIYQKYIQPVISSSIDCQIFSPDISWQKDILNILLHIFSLQDEQDSCELQTVMLLLKLWSIMYENTNPHAAEQNNIADIRDRTRLQILLRYIQENHHRNISLEDLSQIVSLSKSSILNLFRRYVHMSPLEYIIDYRLKCAAHLLDMTGSTVCSVAKTTGFDNTGYFCRKFKETFGCTPSQYRHSDH